MHQSRGKWILSAHIWSHPPLLFSCLSMNLSFLFCASEASPLAKPAFLLWRSTFCAILSGRGSSSCLCYDEWSAYRWMSGWPIFGWAASSVVPLHLPFFLPLNTGLFKSVFPSCPIVSDLWPWVPSSQKLEKETLWSQSWVASLFQYSTMQTKWNLLVCNSLLFGILFSCSLFLEISNKIGWWSVVDSEFFLCSLLSSN